jgi:small-conductance mechanosensitive channel
MNETLTALFDIIIFVIVVLLGYVITRVLYSFTYHKLTKTLGRGSAHLVGKSVQYGLLILIIGLSFYYILDFDLVPLIASMGIISIAVAFASQQLAQNAMAGVLVSAIKPFELEDYIEIGMTPTTEWAHVRELSLTHTTLRDKDGRVFNVPNSFFMTNKVINYTKSGLFRVKVTIHVTPSTFPGVERLTEIVKEEAATDHRIMPNIDYSEKQLALSKLEKNMKSLFEKQTNDYDLTPRLEVVDVQKDFVKISIRMWIHDVTEQTDITSSIVDKLRIRLAKEHIEFAND